MAFFETWKGSRPGACFLSLLLLVCSCGGETPVVLGDAFDTQDSVPLGALLAEPFEEGRRVVVSGKIGEVCGSAGCWFVLQDSRDGKYSELYIDLAGGADFTISTEMQGRQGHVMGTLVGARPDIELNARGLRID